MRIKEEHRLILSYFQSKNRDEAMSELIDMEETTTDTEMKKLLSELLRIIANLPEERYEALLKEGSVLDMEGTDI